MFFSVRLPQEHSGVDLPAACPMFFSREWSVGRVVDFIAQKHKLLNDNHVPQAPVSLSVCLFVCLSVCHCLRILDKCVETFCFDNKLSCKVQLYNFIFF